MTKEFKLREGVPEVGDDVVGRAWRTVGHFAAPRVEVRLTADRVTEEEHHDGRRVVVHGKNTAGRELTLTYYTGNVPVREMYGVRLVKHPPPGEHGYKTLTLDIDETTFVKGEVDYDGLLADLDADHGR